MAVCMYIFRTNTLFMCPELNDKMTESSNNKTALLICFNVYTICCIKSCDVQGKRRGNRKKS